MPGCDKAYFHSRSLRKHIKSSHMKNSSTSSARNIPSVTQSMMKKRQQQKKSTSAAIASIRLEQHPIIPQQTFSNFYIA